MQFGKRIGPLARRVAAMQIPVYAGNASFFLLLSVFPVVSLLLSLLPYTPLTLDHLLAFCEEFAPDWTLRALEFFVRTLYASSSAAIVSASAVLTLWSASKGMLSLLYGLDAVAEVRETRGYVQRRLLCVLYTVGMLLALLLTLGLYVGGQALLRFLFRIRAPGAAKRTSLYNYRYPDSRAIMDTISLNIKYCCCNTAVCSHNPNPLVFLLQLFTQHAGSRFLFTLAQGQHSCK